MVWGDMLSDLSGFSLLDIVLWCLKYFKEKIYRQEKVKYDIREEASNILHTLLLNVN